MLCPHWRVLAFRGIDPGFRSMALS